MKDTVARLMDEARRRAGQDAELANLIRPVVGRTYGKQVISGWALGRVMPPASVLLAACKVTGLSVDAALYGKSQEERIGRLETTLEAIEKELRQWRDPKSAQL